MVKVPRRTPSSTVEGPTWLFDSSAQSSIPPLWRRVASTLLPFWVSRFAWTKFKEWLSSRPPFSFLDFFSFCWRCGARSLGFSPSTVKIQPFAEFVEYLSCNQLRQLDLLKRMWLWKTLICLIPQNVASGRNLRPGILQLWTRTSFPQASVSTKCIPLS